MPEVVVIGAGVGGLAAAAALARAGLAVTVLEAHIYPGGCAGTFYHQGYRFDAGATLAGGFYPGGPMDLLAQAAGIGDWGAHPADPAMVVHLPGEEPVGRYAGARGDVVYREAFGKQAVKFWAWQKSTAEALWELALLSPAWPPQSAGEAASLVATGAGWLRDGGLKRAAALPALGLDAVRPVAAHLNGASQKLRLFVDAQLLISAQTTSAYANALYGASALDLPERGVVHLAGGMGSIARRLAEAVIASGGQVLYRHEVQRIVMEGGKPVCVKTRRGDFPAQVLIGNLTPWNLRRLLGEQAPPRLKQLPGRPRQGWGAFMLYLGVDGSLLPPEMPLHHQVVVRRPLGEGNSVFISASPAWDTSRGPTGCRTLTISTHTGLDRWWELFEHDRAAYEALKEDYAQRLTAAAETALPGLRQAVRLRLRGTPVTFQRFTRRLDGWVGGFPQTGLLQTWGPRLGEALWMVGDSIFPGQSTAAAALGGLRVADAVRRWLNR